MAEKEKKGKGQAGKPQTAQAKGEGKKEGKTSPAGSLGVSAQLGRPEKAPEGYIPRLKKLYQEEIIPRLRERFGYKNVMLVPKLDKIVVNVGAGTLHQDPKLSESIQEELKLITGQKPVLTRARRAISNFKVRKGMVVGCMVTLRGDRMYEFFDRLISTAIPRIRDFRGFSDRSFDGRGNYTMGIKEQIVFHEIDYDKVAKIHGMDITIATTARTDEEALELLKAFGFPFRRRASASSSPGGEEGGSTEMVMERQIG